MLELFRVSSLLEVFEKNMVDNWLKLWISSGFGGEATLGYKKRRFE